ncbi:MAG: NUDIX hydrolase [Spirochaetaceae bacterium]|nr:NUDIX hydrolase [Spirochaetaceae bacterium]
MNKKIAWQEVSRAKVFKTRVFEVAETRCRPPSAGEGKSGEGKAGEESVFSVIESRDWAIVIPVLELAGNERAFVMVRQWRHGALEESLEFPGGVVETGEAGAEGARRELREETGYRAGKITKLATMSPNPAIMNNRIHFFLAEELCFEGEQHLDKDEFVTVEIHNEAEVLRAMGEPPYIHALMAAALVFYLRKNTGTLPSG